MLYLLTGLPNVTTGAGGTIFIGNSTTITCRVTGNYTAVFWEHQYNGPISKINTTGSTKYSGGTVSTPTPSLTIYNFSVGDIGSYRCSGKNSVGTAHSPTMAFVDIPKCKTYKFVCLEFIVPLENFSLIWGRHHYQ